MLGPEIVTDPSAVPRCATGVEFVGNVRPSNYKGLVTLRRFHVDGSIYQDNVFSMPTPKNGQDDTSLPDWLDQDPSLVQSYLVVHLLALWERSMISTTLA
jgi:hypothetical protein